VLSRAETTAVRPLRAADLADADRIMRLAFGTFLNLPEPASFMGDADYVRTRWLADPDAAFAAEIADELVGSNFATHWGSVGFFGPLSVRPDLWNRGVAKQLMEPVMDSFARRDVAHAGLFTFAHSQKHVGLYQKFGFWPRFLTAIMSRPVRRASGEPMHWTRFSQAPETDRASLLERCRRLTDRIYEGLDVGAEIRAVADQDLGDTALLWDEGDLAGFAVCHSGAGSEAGTGTCYVKFGATRPGASASREFARLLDACDELAAERGLSRIVAGANTARHEAYRHLLERGFRTEIQGVAMQRPDEPGYNRPGVFLIDDWR
jgi:GNAT superfamily N-acetyltransferase